MNRISLAYGTSTRLHLHGPAALIVGHPGHELRVHGWLEVARPLVFVLTDGSGRTGNSRVSSTKSIVNQAGATPGRLFGAITDEAAYEAILNHDFGSSSISQDRSKVNSPIQALNMSWVTHSKAITRSTMSAVI